MQKFLYRQKKYLTPRLIRLLCNAFIQSHFDYRSISNFSLPNKNVKHKLQTAQNKCLRLVLDLTPRSHTGAAHSRKMGLLPVSERVESCIATSFQILEGYCTIIY